jgi:hypothetical protein
MFLNDLDKPLAQLWIWFVCFLGKNRQSKADCQSYKGNHCADFHSLLRCSSLRRILGGHQALLLCREGNKAIERSVPSSFQIAQSLGFNGDYRAWEHLLRIHQ